MRKLIKTFFIFSILFLCASCDLLDMIPKFQFSTTVSQDYIAGKYYYTQTEDPNDSLILLTLFTDTSFSFAGADDTVSYPMPEKGVYSVTYSTFTVTSASGTILFKNLDTGESSQAEFVWTADAVDGPLSLRLTFPDKNKARFNLVYGGAK